MSLCKHLATLQKVCLAGKFGVDVHKKAGDFNVRGGQGNVEKPQKDDVALFLHTSGTTSRPKGVPLNQGNLAASLSNIALTYELNPKDRSYLVMPLFHVHGLMAGGLYDRVKLR